MKELDKAYKSEDGDIFESRELALLDDLEFYKNQVTRRMDNIMQSICEEPFTDIDFDDIMGELPFLSSNIGSFKTTLSEILEAKDIIKFPDKGKSHEES